MNTRTIPEAEHYAQLQEKDHEIEVLFGRIRAIREAEAIREADKRGERLKTLEGRIERLLRIAKKRNEEIAALKSDRAREVEALEARIQEILRSNSWALTAPMRVAKNVALRVMTWLKPLPPPPAALGGETETTGPDRRRQGKEASSRRINVIIPMYNNLHGTKHCVEKVVASLEYNRCESIVTVINDDSTEEGFSEYLREIAVLGCVVLHNRQNLGFVKTVNYGMQNTPQDDVVLLNTDTEVNGNWLDRLQRCAYYERNIGTVTPFSNNAESCSFPSVFHDNKLPAGTTAAAVDAAFSNVSGYDPVDLPTAVGFCMFIKRDCLDEVGLFDDFMWGRGYGEENDFCAQASLKGWRSVLCPNVFVFHEGGGTFGLEKKERMQHAQKVFDRKYPHYAESLRRYMESDPAKDIRLRAMLSLLKSSDKPVILYLTHGLGGGSDRHVFDLVDFLGDQAFGIIVHASGPEECVLVLDGRKQTLTLRFNRERQRELVRFLTSCRVSKVHVHNGWRVPDWIFALPKRLGVPYDITVHDYFYINGNPHLMDENEMFCADEERRDECCANELKFPIPDNLTADLFRVRNTRFIKDADRVLMPSQYALELMSRYFPDANYILADHMDRELGGPYPSVVVRPAYVDEMMRIAVLGTLGRFKGADILDYVAMQTEAQCEFHLIGTAYRTLDAAIIQHGSYAMEDLPTLIDETDPHLIWFPVTVPETYSYTLSESLYSGRPIVAPDIGSFQERTRNRPYTYIEPWNKPKSDWVVFFRTLRVAFQNETPQVLPWQDQPLHAFQYKRDYLLDRHDNPSQ